MTIGGFAELRLDIQPRITPYDRITRRPTESGLRSATLTFLEIVLGVDNIIFISILSGKLPQEQQPRARRLGLLAAMVTRVLLLFSLAWIIRLTTPVVHRGRHRTSPAAI